MNKKALYIGGTLTLGAVLGLSYFSGSNDALQGRFQAFSPSASSTYVTALTTSHLADSQMIPAESEAVEIGPFHFEGGSEDLVIDDLSLEINASSVANNISRLEVKFEDSDGNTVTEPCSPYTTTLYDCLAMDLFVGAGDRVNMNVIIEISSVSMIDSGEEFYFELSSSDFGARLIESNGAYGAKVTSFAGSASTNPMTIVNTKSETEQLASTRTGSTSSSEEVMGFTLKSDGEEDLSFRTGVSDTMEDASLWDARGHLVFSPTPGLRPSTGGSIVRPDIKVKSGLSSSSDSLKFKFDDYKANDYVFTELAGASNYGTVSFWINSRDSFSAGDLELYFDTEDDFRNGSGDEVSYSLPSFGGNEWTHVTMDVDLDAGQEFLGFMLKNAPATTVDFQVDELVFHDDMIQVELTLNEDWIDETPTLAYLKQDGITVATAYTSLSGRDGYVQFVPYASYGEIQVAAQSTDTFTIHMDTATHIQDDSSSTEMLVTEINEGGYQGSGDLYWYDGDEAYKWYGVHSTDRITTVSSY